MLKKSLATFVILGILVSTGYSIYLAQLSNKNKQEIKQEIPKPLQYKDLLTVDLPASNQVISNPLKVSGKARGNWYFEASFPGEVLDEDGSSLGTAPVQAQGDWMTTSYVPFSGEITFKQPKGKIGKVVFHKDNPSGLPENEDSFTIIVKFK